VFRCGLLRRILIIFFKTSKPTLVFNLSFLRRDETGGTAVAQWLRCCATNRKVAGSIPAGVIGIFH